jgi:hypothetical protein
MMLKHRLFCKKLPKTFDLLVRQLDELDQNLRVASSKVIDKDTRTMIISRRNKVIGQLKLDTMAIHISTAETTAPPHAKIAKEEKEKTLLLLLSLQSDGAQVDEAVINNIINTI